MYVDISSIFSYIWMWAHWISLNLFHGHRMWVCTSVLTNKFNTSLLSLCYPSLPGIFLWSLNKFFSSRFFFSLQVYVYTFSVLISHLYTVGPCITLHISSNEVHILCYCSSLSLLSHFLTRVTEYNNAFEEAQPIWLDKLHFNGIDRDHICHKPCKLIPVPNKINIKI